ncbi:MAG: winged helix-turn-helix domain-containing protein [Candidatus Hodarchaeales archaeon]|jgi:DNA-binding transcriptional ArsR family regulator
MFDEEITKMTTTTVNTKPDLKQKLELLFKSETRALITWNLIIHKELTVKQLTKLINKDSSTITRNLRNLEREGLVLISKTDTIRNLAKNSWKLNPNSQLKSLGDFDTVIKKALVAKDFDFMKIILLAVQRNLENILNYQKRDITKFVDRIQTGKELMSIGIMDRKTGILFREELYQFICKFQEDHNLNLQSIDKFGSDSFFTFLLASPFPSLE